MPKRHRHEEFIWALIFSLIINLLFVFALATSCYDKKSEGLQPFVVSIAASLNVLPGKTPAALSTIAVAPPVKTKKVAEASPALQTPSISSDPLLPTKDIHEEETIHPVTVAARTGEELAKTSSEVTGEEATATGGKERSAGLSILGDKISGDNYTAPEYLTGEKPHYPQRAERNGWEGTVLLSLSINTNGEIEKVGITKTSGYALLDHQARKSVSAWRFKPARRNGVAIAITVQQPIIFRPTPPENSP